MSIIDAAIVGGGAAGLATAIFARRLSPAMRIVVLDGARQPGAKILVSGGSRCNVTNARVSEQDFWGGRHTIVRRVLRALSVAGTVAFFEEIGIRLHEEEHGKLFPDSNRSRDVLDALLAALDRCGAELRAGTRVTAVERDGDGFRLETSAGPLHAAHVVLATGGQSLPKTGSDGIGYEFARRLGHTIVPTTPGLAPLVLGGDTHRALSGVSHDVELTIWVDDAVALRLEGSLLWTHFGISGPAVLNASRHWLRARLEGRRVRITASFVPGERFEQIDARLSALARERARASVATVLAGGRLPAAVVAEVLRQAAIDGEAVMAHLTRDRRRRLAHLLSEWPFDVVDSRGYNYAEVTAGGVALDEIDPATMASRKCAGLFLVGEILDVDGRIGGFNFQWAWSGARAAAEGLARACRN
jgi:predicted Rossmann fold flavoprotein